MNYKLLIFSTIAVTLSAAMPYNQADIQRLQAQAYSYANFGQTTQALKLFNTLLIVSPEHTKQTLYNIGYVLKSAGMIDQAIAAYEKALSIDPTYAEAEFALGMAYLQQGDFERGWKHHEKYLIKARKNSPELRALLAAHNLDKKIILIRPEGGIGDYIQFIRYAQNLKALGAVVYAAAPPTLIPLLSRCAYIDQLFSTKEPLPPCHDWCAVMSLPAIFNANEQTVPREIPYLFPDPERLAYWKQYLKDTTQIKIGICWQASVQNDASRPPCARRGMPLAQLLKLADLPHVTLYSLQQQDGLEQLASSTSTKLVTFDASFDTEHGAFMDTAALMTQLNLVITVDTAVAHIAGALGVPVWLLLPYCTDWRWIAGRQDSPWYPTMRIFKQQQPFDWDSVMQEVSAYFRDRFSSP